MRQRPPQLPHRKVKRIGVPQRPHVLGPEVKPPLRGRQQPPHIAVADQHPLGPPRRARRVDHIGQIASRHTALGIALAGSAPQLCHVLQTQHHGARRGHPLPHALLRQHHPHARVVHEKAQVLGRIRRIKRQVRPPRLEHPQNRHHQLHRPLQTQPHHPLRPYPPRPQLSRQRIGPRVQHPVRHHPALSAHRHRPRRPPHLPLE